MKLPLGRIVNSERALQSLSSKELPSGMAYKIFKNIKLLEPELEVFRSTNDQAIRKYGEERDGQIMIDPNSSSFAQYAEEINPILVTEVDVDIEILKMSDLLDALDKAEATISVSDLASLEYMLEE